MPSRARMAFAAKGMFKLTPGQVYVVVHFSYNARDSVYIKQSEGLETVFSYGDGHGMRWGGLFRVVADAWVLDLAVPPTYRGQANHRIAGSRTSFENKDEELYRENATRV